MARRKQRPRHDGPTTPIRLACRRAIDVQQRVGRDVFDQNEKYLERTISELFETHPFDIPVPAGLHGEEEVQCPSCGRRVLLQTASPAAAILSRFQATLWVLVIGLAVLPVLALVPDVRALSAQYFGGPLGIARVVLVLFGILLVGCALIGLFESPLHHAVWTKDFKHQVQPRGEDDED